MQETSQKNNKILAIIIVILLLAATFFLGAKTASKDCASDYEKANLSVENKAQERLKPPVVIYLPDKADQESTVFSGLLNYGSKNDIEIKYNNNYDFGVFIESIGGIKNGDEGKYWQYYINDALGDVAADKKNLSNGDVVEWRFEEIPF